MFVNFCDVSRCFLCSPWGIDIIKERALQNLSAFHWADAWQLSVQSQGGHHKSLEWSFARCWRLSHGSVMISGFALTLFHDPKQFHGHLWCHRCSICFSVQVKALEDFPALVQNGIDGLRGLSMWHRDCSSYRVWDFNLRRLQHQEIPGASRNLGVSPKLPLRPGMHMEHRLTLARTY